MSGRENLSRRPKPALLYITPVVPRHSGAGISMRAGSHVSALCSLFDVTLAIVNPDEEELGHLPPDLKECCSSVIVIERPSRYTLLCRAFRARRTRLLLELVWPFPAPMAKTDAALAELARVLVGRRFAVIHCFRMHTARILGRLRPEDVKDTQAILDIDDYESRARFRYAKNSRADIGLQMAMLRWFEGVKYLLAEALTLPRFNTASVCSEIDRRVLSARFPSVEWVVVPNVVPPPELGERGDSGVFNFLFVGTLDYPPNNDGILYFCREVLPLLRRGANKPFKITIAGRNPGTAVRQLSQLENVEVVANPQSVAPYYWQADACIAPIRAGGGTRIKILEAFSHRVAVVATSLAAEGLDVIPDGHAAIADDPAGFAEACLRVLADDHYRQRLAAAGYDLYRSSFSSDSLVRVFAAIHGETLRRRSPE